MFPTFIKQPLINLSSQPYSLPYLESKGNPLIDQEDYDFSPPLQVNVDRALGWGNGCGGYVPETFGLFIYNCRTCHHLNINRELSEPIEQQVVLSEKLLYTATVFTLLTCPF